MKLLSQISVKPITWLWDGRIPLGELTILEGDPGTAKSAVTHDLVARLTQGRAMPGIAPKPGRKRKAGALLLVGEDSVARTVRGRLTVAGANLDMVGVEEDITIPDDLIVLERAVSRLGAKLIVVDSINDFLKCNTLGNQATRAALRPLRQLAERLDCAVILLRHFVKRASSSLHRGGGSVAFTAAARSQLKLYEHPEDANLRVLVQDKSNLGPLSPPLLLEIVQADCDTPYLKWHGECEFTIDDLERPRKRRPKSEAGERLLLTQLADGPKLASYMYKQAQGICSERTLIAAKKALEVKTVRQGKGRAHKVYWSL